MSDQRNSDFRPRKEVQSAQGYFEGMAPRGRPRGNIPRKRQLQIAKKKERTARKKAGEKRVELWISKDDLDRLCPGVAPRGRAEHLRRLLLACP